MKPTINRDIIILHRDFFERLVRARDRLRQEGIGLDVYEAWRHPIRQAAIYARGRTVPGEGVAPGRPLGRTATQAPPWHSKHQYGLAVDLVFWVSGQPSWAEPRKGQWARYHEIAEAEGLTPLRNKKGEIMEMPHVEHPWPIGKLMNGDYPLGGGEAWASTLEELSHDWSLHPLRDRFGEAPPIPILRPHLPEDLT